MKLTGVSNRTYRDHTRLMVRHPWYLLSWHPSLYDMIVVRGDIGAHDIVYRVSGGSFEVVRKEEEIRDLHLEKLLATVLALNPPRETLVAVLDHYFSNQPKSEVTPQ